MSQVMLDIVERYAHVSHWIERIEGIVLARDGLPPDQYYELLDRQIRLAALIGLDRKARRLPSLSEYLESKSQESPVAASVAPPAARAGLPPSSRTGSPTRDAATEGSSVDADASE